MRIIFFSIFCFVAFNLGANPSLSALNAPCTADAYNNSCGSTFYNVYKVKLDTKLFIVVCFHLIMRRL